MKVTYNRSMLSTKDNPYDYFEDFNNWFMFDIEKGYYSCAKLARVIDLFKPTNDMTEKEDNELTERAIDLIISQDFLDIFVKIKQEYQVEVSETE